MRRILSTSKLLHSTEYDSLHYMPDKDILYASRKSGKIDELNKRVSKPTLKYANFTDLDTVFNEGKFLDWSEDVSPIEFENNITLSSTKEIIDDKTLVYPYVGTRIGAYKTYCARVFEENVMNKSTHESGILVVNRNIIVFIDNNTVTTNASKTRGRPYRNGFVFYTFAIIEGTCSSIEKPTSVENLNASTNKFRTMSLYDNMSTKSLNDSWYSSSSIAFPKIDSSITKVEDATSYQGTKLASLRNGFITYDSSDKSITYTDASFFPMLGLNNDTQTTSFDDYYDSVYSNLLSWGLSSEISIYLLLRSIGLQSNVSVIADGASNDSRTNFDYWYLSEFLYTLFYSAFKTSGSYYPIWTPTKYMGSPSSLSFEKFIDTSAGYMRIYDSEMNDFEWARYKLEGWSRTYTILAPRNTTHHGSVFSQEGTAVGNWESKRTNNQTFYNTDFDAWRKWASALLLAKHSDDPTYSTDNLFSSVVIGAQSFNLTNMSIIRTIGTTLQPDGTIVINAYIDDKATLLFVKNNNALGSTSVASWTLTIADTQYSYKPNKFILIAKNSDNEYEEVDITFFKKDADSVTNAVVEAFHYQNNL